MPRRHGRVRIQLRVRYGLGTADRTGIAETISESGMYINTNEPHKVGTRILVQIDFPDRTILQRAEVVWAIRVPEHQRGEMMCGMGVSFVDIDPKWPRFFKKWREDLRDRVLTAAR